MNDIVNKIVPIDRIDPHPRNYRNHPDEQISDLAASQKRFGQYRSVVLWERPGGRYMQVAGHGVLETMKRLSVSDIRADILPLHTPQETIDAILVADNNIPLKSSDDSDLLATLLQEQQNAGFDLSALGSDDEQLRQMLESLRPAHAADFLEGVLSSGSSGTGNAGTWGRESDGEDEDEEPELHTDGISYFQVTYSVTSEQRAILLQAISKARGEWGLATSQDSLVAICSHFLDVGNKKAS